MDPAEPLLSEGHAPRRRGGGRSVVLVLMLLAVLAVVVGLWVALGGLRDTEPALTRDQALERLTELGEKFDGAVQNGRDTSPLEPEVQRLVELWPDLPQGWTLLGQVYLDQNDLDQAVAAFDRALAIDDTSPSLHLLAGAAAELIGRPDEAVVHYKRALALQPDKPDTLVRLANVAFKQKRYDDCSAFIESALAKDDGYHEAYAMRSALHEARGEMDAAMDDIERAYRDQREVGGEALRGYALRLAKLLRRAGDPMAAAKMLRLPKPEDFFQKDIMAAHAEALAEAGYAFEAGQYYQSWVARDPVNSDAAAEAIRWYLQAGEAESAGNMIVKLQIINPRDPRLPGLREQLRALQQQPQTQSPSDDPPTQTDAPEEQPGG